ncbi:hypothetical protein EJB05_16455, partial [Eragrostis curvula]
MPTTPALARRSFACSPRRSDFPAWILLDGRAHIGRHDVDETTTAETVASAGRPIKVSLVAVDPPGVSRCVVHCADLSTTTPNSRQPVLVTGAGGRFLLLRVPFPERLITDVFVYRACPTTPALHLVPRPYPLGLRFDHVGVLPCGNGDDDGFNNHCLVVVPELRIEDIGPASYYDLHVFSTETQSWSTIAARVVGSVGGCELLIQFHLTKVLAVGGGGVLAWIDLRHGIPLCDVLAEDPEMRLLVEMESHLHVTLNDSGRGATTTTRGGTWTATVFERTVCSDKWEKRCAVNSTDLAPAADSISLPDVIWSYEENKMKRVVCRDPVLGVCGQNVVYMICRLDARDSKGWVLPVDTERKELGKAMAFSAERYSFDHTYIQLDFSKYLGKATGNQ